MKVYYDYEDKRDYEKCDCREEKKCYKKDDYDRYDKCGYYEKSCCDEHKYEKCCPKNPCPYPIIFECAQGTGTTIPGTDTGTTRFEPRSLGCVTIDTTCLKNPVVLFNFSAIIRHINLDDVAVPTRLTFALFKQCENGDEIQCGTWDYVIDFRDSREQITNSYSFSHCECNSCPGCCTYTVKIIAAVNGDPDNILDVSNSTLSVFAKSAC
ncbi:DUF4489 domain-containing protein [Clostridium sp.]|jgi:hypothetical protein|uniref:DUF4489 domain-containing protein n=1 Tax=Clostridium sp. TaxID=1506 RepID=UPI0039F4A2B4